MLLDQFSYCYCELDLTLTLKMTLKMNDLDRVKVNDHVVCLGRSEVILFISYRLHT